MSEQVGSVRQQHVDETIRYSMEWSDRLAPEVKSYPALSRDKLTTSEWAIGDASSTDDFELIGEGFSDTLGIAWVAVKAGPTVADGALLVLRNEVTTTGILPNGLLVDTTAAQTMVREYRVRFKD